MSLDQDFVERAKFYAQIEEVVGKFVPLKRSGRRYNACCPFHEEKSPSFYVTPAKGIFKCFGCGKSGDSISFLMQYLGLPFQGAIMWLANEYSLEPNIELPAVKREPKPEPQPDYIAKPSYNAFYPRPNTINQHCYKTQDGIPYVYVCRIPTKTGGKMYMPFTYRGYRWEPLGLQYTRPLYNLDLLHKHPELPVLIVEGEKTADAAMTMYEGLFVVTTWMSGSNSIKKTDFSPIMGRKVYLSPDNDKPGFRAMGQVIATLELDEAFIIMPPEGSPKGWDLADVEGYYNPFEHLKLWTRG